MSYLSSKSTYAEEPDRSRSRNAVAQARHRAKKKAYIEQLESTVSKLQIEIGLTTEEVGVLPPASQKIRELEFENERLRRELIALRRSLDYDSPLPKLDSAAYSPGGSSTGYDSDRESKRNSRALEINTSGLYTIQSPRVIESVPRSRGLSTYVGYSDAYGMSTHNGGSGASSAYNLQPPSTAYSNGSSGSSSAPSPPPYSADYQSSRLSPLRNPRLSPNEHAQNASSAQGYSQGGYFEMVKLEDANYRSVPYNESQPFSHMSMASIREPDTQWSTAYSDRDYR